MAPEGREKATLSCHDNLFWFTRMPFGLKNAPGTFERVVDIFLSTVRWKYALVYLDDTIVFSTSPSYHLGHVQEVIGIIQSEGMKLCLTKHFFMQTSVYYRGYVIYPGKLEVASQTFDAISGMKPRIPAITYGTFWTFETSISVLL